MTEERWSMGRWHNEWIERFGEEWNGWLGDDSNGDPRGLFWQAEYQEIPREAQGYLRRRVKARFSHRTFTNRRQTYRHYARWTAVKEREFLAPSKVDVEDFIDEQLNAGYSIGTVENRLYDLSVLWAYLEDRDVVATNPLGPTPQRSPVNLKRIKTSSAIRQIRYIEHDDYRSLLDECEKLRDELILRILWECGLRSYELVNLTVEQVEAGREKMQIELITAKQYEDEKRTVFYGYKLKDTLQRWLDEGGREKYRSADESSHLLVGRGSKQLNANRPTEVIREFADSAGVQAKLGDPNAAGEQRQTVTAHAFRHSYAVHRVRKGCPIVYVQDLLGHTDISQTREYLRFRKDDIREADKEYRPRA